MKLSHRWPLGPVLVAMLLAGCQGAPPVTAPAATADKATPTAPVLPDADPDSLAREMLASQGVTFKSFGDPHENSGDGAQFDNQLTGVFQKIFTVQGDFGVISRQTFLGADTTVKYNTAIAVIINKSKGPGQTVVTPKMLRYFPASDKAYLGDFDGSSVLNKTAFTFPPGSEGKMLPLPGGGYLKKTANVLEVYSQAWDYVKITDQGSYVDFEGKIGPIRPANTTFGSLGAFDSDNDPTNDLVYRNLATRAPIPGGYLMTDSVKMFLESWRVPVFPDAGAADES